MLPGESWTYDLGMADPRALSRVETAIAQVWRDLLTVPEFGPDDDFFQLGGDSLRAVEMLAAIDELLLTLVDFPDFLETPTVAGLAEAVERRDVAGEPDPEVAAERLVDDFVSRPFDLERGPLVRALLVRLGAADHVLELVFDHIVCDGWSHIVVFDELARLYDAYREDR